MVLTPTSRAPTVMVERSRLVPNVVGLERKASGGITFGFISRLEVSCVPKSTNKYAKSEVNQFVLAFKICAMCSRWTPDSN